MRNFYVLLSLGVLLAAVAFVVRTGVLARKDPGQPINKAMRQAIDSELAAQKWSAEDERIVAEKFPNAQKTASGLLYIVRSPGEEGPTPEFGSKVTANYEGRLLDGTKFGSSQDSGRPLVFTVGVGKVIRGWDEAFIAMKKGEKRTLIVPHWLAYGEKGRGPIPPRATLVFEMELVSFR